MPRSPETHIKMRECHEVWDLFDHEAMLDEMMEKLEYRSFDCPSYTAPRSLFRRHDVLEPVSEADRR